MAIASVFGPERSLVEQRELPSYRIHGFFCATNRAFQLVYPQTRRQGFLGMSR